MEYEASNKPTYEQLWAALHLAAEDELFFNRTWWDEKDPNKLMPYIVVNDTFAWATADAETVEWEELPEMVKIYFDKKHRCSCEAGFYLIKWVADKRGYLPIKPVLQAMEEGHWNGCHFHPKNLNKEE